MGQDDRDDVLPILFATWQNKQVGFVAKSNAFDAQLHPPEIEEDHQ